MGKGGAEKHRIVRAMQRRHYGTPRYKVDSGSDGKHFGQCIKYTPEGGRVSVTVCPWQFYTRIDISDTGIGIPKEHYNDVFQRFYRAEEVAAEEGVGLGLYLANGIVTRQKGYISVKSKAGEGTTFSVYLLS